jgi:hypothetical protein
MYAPHSTTIQLVNTMSYLRCGLRARSASAEHCHHLQMVPRQNIPTAARNGLNCTMD